VSFCEHYGTVIMPTKPAMPRHKGKIEAGIKYVQANGLAGKQFVSLGAQNVHLAHWEETVADTRIHGTTRQQVRAHFLTVEKPKLLPLPASLFPVFSEAPRKIRSHSLERLSGCLFGRGKIGIGQALGGERAQQPRCVDHIVPPVTSNYYQTLRRIFHT
jgi:hypothetical protein